MLNLQPATLTTQPVPSDALCICGTCHNPADKTEGYPLACCGGRLRYFCHEHTTRNTREMFQAMKEAEADFRQNVNTKGNRFKRVYSIVIITSHANNHARAEFTHRNQETRTMWHEFAHGYVSSFRTNKRIHNSFTTIDNLQASGELQAIQAGIIVIDTKAQTMTRHVVPFDGHSVKSTVMQALHELDGTQPLYPYPFQRLLTQ